MRVRYVAHLMGLMRLKMRLNCHQKDVRVSGAAALIMRQFWICVGRKGSCKGRWFGLLLLMLVVGCSEPEVVVTAVSTQSPEVQLGNDVYVRECGACHSTFPDTVIVGPSLFGIGQRAKTRVLGQDGRTYLFTSILLPDEYLVDGYENLMPATFGKTLTGEELDGVVAYLMTLGE